MSFPSDERDLVAEIYAADGWRDISGDVRVDPAITITRGRRNEGGIVDPSTCALTIDNRTGDYSPRNPASAYYGTLGRNTPLRMSVRHARDTFTRAVSGSWSSADTGQVWAQDGAGGTVQASDFNVAAGVGTHLVPVANAQRFTYLSTLAHKDLEVAVTVSLPFSDVTGGGLFPASIIFRAPDVSNYYMVRVGITTSEQIQISVVKNVLNATTQVGSTVTTALAFSGQALRVRAHVEGSTLRGKVWAAASAEPLAWDIEEHDDTLTTPGWVGIRSEVATGNTNVPVTFSYDDLQITSPRFCGEVSEWPARWDISGRDVTAPIQAAGIMRRLGQGASPLRSALRRSIPDLGPRLIAYWPCEEGKRATQVVSGIGGLPGTFDYTGYPDWASYDGFAASDPLPVMNNARWDGAIETYTGTGVIQVRMLLHVDEAGSTHLSPLFQLWTTAANATLWEVRYRTGGALDIVAFAAGSGTPFYTSGIMGFAVDGKDLRLGFWIDQDGADIDWKLETLEPGAAFGLAVEDTVSSATVGDAVSVVVNPHMNHDNVAIGHVTVENETSTLFDLRQELVAYAGETAGNRISRLCSEEGVPFSYIGDLDETELMGSQLSDTLLDLLHECEAVDGGTLFESRGSLGLAYRTLASIYNQPARLAAEYGHTSPPFEPTDDDQWLRNDITVRRPGGSEVRAQQSTGPLSVADPPSGVGRYDTSLELNVYNDEQARQTVFWLLHVGTVDEARYPSVTINLASTSVVDDNLEPQVLDATIDDRMTISGLPSWLPPGPASLLVRGYTERIGPYEHRLTYVCAPESPHQVARLGSGKLDTAGSKLVTAADSDDTSFTVAREGDFDEGFEDATYELGITGTWTRTNTQAHSGSWSLRSAVISHSQQTDAVIAIPAAAATAQFWFRVSSESGFDFLRVYIDGVFWGEASGTIGWTQTMVYPVAGKATLTVRYIKDSSTSTGEDAAYIDDFQFRSDAPLWTTTDEPVSLLIGGEEVTATTITGSTSPQTFTVTRSVNGIAKSHAAGTSIALKTPATLAL